MSIQLHVLDAKHERGHIHATVKAVRDDGGVAFADTVKLNTSADRRRFVRELSERLNGDSPGLAVLDDKLLGVYVQVSTDLEGDSERGEKPQSQATTLVELAQAAELFHDRFGEAYATVPIGGHYETWQVQSKGFRDWLARVFYAKQNGAPSSQALADAAAVLRGRALFDGPEKLVNVRVAELGGAIYLDTGNDQREAIEITPSGWRPVAKPPVQFKRPRGMLALPRPEPGGSVDLLRPYLNIQDPNDWRLALCWLIQAFRPTGPYPVLTLHGEQGSAKSTASRVLRGLVDPNAAPIRSLPRDERDLVIAASNGWVVAFDNVSRIPDWLSDGLCRLATGGGFSTRALHTDSDEMLFDATRPILLNAIEDVALRGDLQDRALTLFLANLTKRTRRSETSFWAAFERDRPKILGALLDVVSLAIKEVPNVTLAELPRMADFAIWSAAAAPKLGWTAKQFSAAYDDNIRSTESLPLDASPLGKPIRDLLELSGPFNGTAGELLEALNSQADGALQRLKTWPKDATRLAGELRRLAPYFRAEGIEIEFIRTGARRSLTVRRQSETTPPDDDGSDADSVTQRHSSVTQRHSASPAGGNSTDAHEQNTPAASQDDADDADDAGLPSSSPSGVCHSTNMGLGALPLSGGTHPEGKKGGNPASLASLASLASPAYDLVSDPTRLREVLPDLLAAVELGLDTETTGLDPRSDRVRLVQLATPERVYIVDAFGVGDLSPLAVLLDGQRGIIGHNLKFDLAMLAASGLPVPNGDRLFDTQLAAMLLGAGLAEGMLNKSGLADVCERYLGERPDKTEQRADWSGELSDEMLVYAAKDAAILLPLAARIRQELATERLEATALLEMRTLPAIVWLEQAGAPFDSAGWRALSDAAVAEQIELEEQLTQLAGVTDLFGKGTINWASPTQVKKVLEARGYQLASANEEALSEIAVDEPLAGLLLKYRSASKMASTYGIETLNRVNRSTGRIHADFLQLGSRAGRMSCARPNLQQVPRDPRYRACFRPNDGRVLVKADYSQIELRIAAEMAPDQRMLAAYQQGDDIHTLTAATVLGRTNGEVTPADRQAAKAINFGLLYGAGADTLRQSAFNEYGTIFTKEGAEALKTKFFETYKGLRSWHRKHGNGLRDTRTVGGRRRRRVARFTEQINTPVQGTGADGLKHALALLWETRDRCPDAVPVLVVHDEIVVECPAESADAARDWLIECMKQGMAAYLKKVPVEVEASIERDWSGK